MKSLGARPLMWAMVLCASAVPRTALPDANDGAPSPVTTQTSDVLSQRLHELRRRCERVFRQAHRLFPRAPARVEAPQITWSVAARFADYIEDDLRHGETARASRELDAVDDMLERGGRRAGQARPGTRSSSLAFAPLSHLRRLEVRNGAVVAVTTDPRTKQQQTLPVFLTGYGAFNQVRADVTNLPSIGANVIQIEIGPRDVFPAPDTIDRAALASLTEVLDRSARAGVAVDLLISPHYFPGWMLDSVPELRRRNEGFLQFCIHHPSSRELLQRYIRVLLGAVGQHPALFSVCLSNEPELTEEPCEPAARRWRSWLRTRHGDVAAFNKAHNSGVNGFEDVALPDPRLRPTDTALWHDFVRFNQEQLADWHQMLADAVHEVAPRLPVHVKARARQLFGHPDDAASGVDATLLTRIGALNGNDSADFLAWPGAEFSQSWLESAMGLDLQRAINPAPVFNSENHLINDREWRVIPASHLRTALWQSAVHGQAATTIWVWERTYERKSDFWGSILERPDSVEAAGLTTLELNHAATEIRLLQQAPPAAAILHAETSLVWDTEARGIEQSLYTALSFNGLKVGFVTERQLEDGVLPASPVVFVPGNVHLSSSAMATLGRSKGRLVFVGGRDLLVRDDHDQPISRPLRAEALGAGEESRAPRELWSALRSAMATWRLQAEVELRDTDGRPVWGVEWSSARVPGARDGLVVNVCNHGWSPVTVTLFRSGTPAAGWDVLSGRRVTRSLELAPPQPRLVRLD